MSPFADGFVGGVGAMVGVLLVGGLLLVALRVFEHLNDDFFNRD